MSISYFNFSGLSPTSSVAQKVRDKTEEEFKNEWFSESGVQIYKDFLNSCHLSISRLLGSKDPEVVSILPNASFGLNASIGLAKLKCNDIVVTSDQEHPSVKKPLEILRRKGIKLIEISSNSDQDFIHQLERQVEQDKPRALILSHVSYKDGRIFPLEKIGKIAHDNQIIFIVDGAQAVGQVRINLNSFCPSVYVFSGHKILGGPMGTGGLWADKKFLSSNGNSWASWTTSDNNGKHPFEVGTLNIGLIAGLEAAINDYLLYQANRHKTILELKLEIMDSLSNIEELKPIQWNGSHAPGIISYHLSNGMNSKSFAEQLFNEYGVVIKPFDEKELRDGLRISLNHEVKPNDVKKLIYALDKMCSKLSTLSYN